MILHQIFYKSSDDPVKGFPTLIEFVLLLGGLQLMAIGIMGEYVGRMYIESKRRPIYFLDYFHPATQALTKA